MNYFLESLRLITSNWKNVLIFIIVTLGVAYYSISFNSELPKPETIVEFGKYYFGNPGPYLYGMFLNLLASLLSFTLSSSLIYFSFSNFNEFHPLVLIVAGLIGLAIFIVSFYFLRYFFLLLVTLILIALVGLFVIKALTDSK